MNHEIDLKNESIRTDLAIESIYNLEEESGIQMQIEEFGSIKVTNVYIDTKGEVLTQKKEGNYITIEFDDVTDFHNRKELIHCVGLKLKQLLKASGIKESDSCLMIGLGNEKSTADALGPHTISNILVTRHLFLLGDVANGFREVCAFAPGVMGETGIETSDFIESIVKKIEPDFVIVIDALASRSMDRVNRTIQMTDTGIHPGSGVMNKRKEISQSTIHKPVFAIGIPTVVDAVTIASDTIKYMQKKLAYVKKKEQDAKQKLVSGMYQNYLKETVEMSEEEKKVWMGLLGGLDEEEIRQLIFEALNPIGFNFIVTPKEMDFVLEQLTEVLSRAINAALHENVTNEAM